MKTTAKTDIVNYVLGLFATLVLLVSWPRGKKGCKGVKWSQVTAQDMADPAYLQKLAEGNIGVIMGPASGGIASIDIDDDQGAEEFLALNPDLKETLRTRGARGCNIWFYPEGEVPASCKLMRDGQSVGEWRWDWRPSEQGTPQGAVISPLLANLYLNPLDHEMAGKGYQMIRYADDFVVCCRTEAEAQAALKEIGRWVQAAGLTLHPTKTRIVNAAERGGFDFLGYHFEQYHGSGGTKWPRQKSQAKLRETLRGKLPRNRSGSIRQIVAEINPSLRGWHGYFKYSLPSGMQDVDQWVRERIRHILRRRHKRQGMVKGRERNEYPIAWFAQQGLFSLKNTQAQWLQSLTGNH